MKFDFKLSEYGKRKFSDALANEQNEAFEYLKSLGIKKETIVIHRGRKYTNLRACRKSALDHWQSLIGDRVSKDGKIGNTEHLWDTFEVADT